MSDYQHSQTFDSLKRIHEEFDNNYTTAQLLNTLDHFLWSALAPICKECPDLFMTFFVKVVARQSVTTIKFSSGDKAEMPSALLNLLTCPPDRRVDYARTLFINRGFLFALIRMFLTLTKYYRRALETAQDGSDPVRSTNMLRIERAVGLRHKGNLYGCILEVDHWAQKAYHFKAIIMEKYTRLAVTHAKKAYTDYGHDLSLDDCLPIYLMTVDKAINRCDSRHGVLATFITSWFKGARSEIDQIVQRRRAETSYEGLVDDSGDALSEVLGYEDFDNTYENVQHLSVCARKVDRRGCVRASLGIPEIVSRKQLKKLQAFILEE